MSAYTSGGGFDGFNVGSQEQLTELSKALEAGYQVSGQTNGSALRVESLEASLKVTTFSSTHIKLWKKIPKSPAYSTVEQYNQLTSYGDSRVGAFLQEGELGATQDSSYVRKTALIKYIGTVRQVSHPMTVVHPAHGDVIALENQNGINWILERIEDSLFHGDSSLAFDGESEQWSGLDAQIDADSFVDLEGQPLQEADVEEAANQIVENYGYPSDIFLGTRVASDFVKTMYPRERISLPAPQNGMVGLSVNSIMTQAGVMELNPNVFLKQAATPPSAATHSNAPAAPTVALVATSTVVVNTGVTNGDFNKGAPAGDTNYYSYVFTLSNRFGESAPSPVSANGTQMTQANKDAYRRIDVTCANPSPIGNFAPEWINLYRCTPKTTNASVTDLASYSLVKKIKVTSQAGGATTVVQDKNLMLPFTEVAYMGEMSPQVLTFRQLLPMMRLDLAVLAPAYRWMILLYGTPILFAPKRWLRLLNIGRLV